MSSMPSFSSFSQEDLQKSQADISNPAESPATLEAEPELIEKPTPTISESETSTSNAPGAFPGSDENTATMSTQAATERSEPAPEPVAQPAQAPIAAPTQTVDDVQSVPQTEDITTTAQAPGHAPDLQNPPKSIAIPSPNKRPPPPLKVLRQWLPIYLSQGDAVINRLTAILSTPQGIDEVLMLIGYSSLLGSAVLTQITKAQLYITVLRLLRLAKENLPEGSTVMISAEGLPAPRSLRAARSLEALSALIGDFRIFMRLWGLLGMYQWGKAAYLQPSKDALTRRVTYAQVAVNTVYQVLENGAYLSSKGVMGWSADKQNKAWLWSSRMWAAHVALEFVKLGHGMLKVKKEARGNLKDSLVNTGSQFDQLKIEKVAEDVVEESKLVADAAVKKAKEDKAWTDGFIKNSAYAPLTLHWSLDGGLVSPFVVGALGTIVGLVNVGNQWRATA